MPKTSATPEATGPRPTEVPQQLVDVLCGLIPLHLIRIAGLSERDRAWVAEQYTDEICAAGDRLTAPENFSDRHERGRALTALAGGLAFGAMQPGRVTWAGHHWCTEPHTDCVNGRRAA